MLKKLNFYFKSVIIVVVLMLLALGVYLAYFMNKKQENMKNSGNCSALLLDPTLGTNEIPAHDSIYDSFPKEKETNTAYEFTAPFSESCVSDVMEEGEKCPPGRKYICLVTPHNQRRCYWE